MHPTLQHTNVFIEGEKSASPEAEYHNLKWPSKPSYVHHAKSVTQDTKHIPREDQTKKGHFWSSYSIFKSNVPDKGFYKAIKHFTR